MNQFETRNAQFQNKKKLIIDSITYKTNGEIKELLVREERNEGDIYILGTELSAENLQMTLKGYLVGETTFNVSPNSTSSSDSVVITCKNPIDIIINNNYDDYFNVTSSFNNNTNLLTITVSALETNVQGSGTEILNFSITICAKEGCILGKVDYVVNYSYASTSPED